MDVIALGVASQAVRPVDGKIPSELLPSYVDDVLEFAGVSKFPAVGEQGKIYVDTVENTTYRWSGTQYILVNGKELPVINSGDAGKVLIVNTDGTGTAWNSIGKVADSTHADSADTATQATRVDLVTTAPTADNTSGLKFVILDEEPSEYKNGYFYIIKE